MKTIKFDIAIEDRDGFFSAAVPALPHVHCTADTAIDVLNKAKEWIESNLKNRSASGEKIEIPQIDLEALKDSTEFSPVTWHVVEVDERLSFKNSKRERRERRPFQLGFFTKGTVCEVHVTHGSDKGPQIVTVNNVVKNGPDSYCITTGQMNPFTETEQGYNLSHVTRIIEQVPGRVNIRSDDSRQDRKKYFEREHGGAYDAYTFKHPSQYRTMAIDQLTRWIALDYAKPDQVYDIQLLVAMLVDRQIVKRIPMGPSNWRFDAYVVNKKKFKKTVKRLLNRFSCSPHKEQVRQEEEYNAQYYRDLQEEHVKLDPEYNAEGATSTDNQGSCYNDDEGYPFYEGFGEEPVNYPSLNVTKAADDFNEVSDAEFEAMRSDILASSQRMHDIVDADRPVAKDVSNKPPSLGDLLRQKLDQMNAPFNNKSHEEIISELDLDVDPPHLH